MSDDFEKDLEKKLEQAYRQMVTRVKEAVNELEEKSRPAIEKAIESTKQAAVKLDGLTRKEADKISKALQKDMKMFAERAKESGQDIQQAIHEDVEYLEDRLWEEMLSLADKTKLELWAFEADLEHGPFYKTGELAAIGTFECESCGHYLHLHKIGHLPPCAKCHKTEFTRVVLSKP